MDDVVYSNVPSAVFGWTAVILYMMEGLVMFGFNTYLVTRILIVKSLRSQREHIILVSLIVFEICFGMVYFTAGFYRMLLKLQYDLFPVHSQWQCFVKLHNQLGVIMLPVAGYVLLFTSLDRLACVYYPIKYKHLPFRYAYYFLILPYILTIPTYTMFVFIVYPARDLQQVSVGCGLSDAISVEAYKVVRGVRIACSTASAIFYIPILLKIYEMTIRQHRSTAVTLNSNKSLFRVTRTVTFITLNTLLLFTIPDIILYINAAVPGPVFTIFNVICLNKGVGNLLIILLTQQALWKKIFKPAVYSMSTGRCPK